MIIPISLHLMVETFDTSSYDIRSNIIQYLRFTTLGCKNIEIGKPEFVAKTQFLC